MKRAMSLQAMKKPLAPNRRKNTGMDAATMFSPRVGLPIPWGNASGPNIIGTKLAITPTSDPAESDTSVPIRGVICSSTATDAEPRRPNAFEKFRGATGCK